MEGTAEKPILIRLDTANTMALVVEPSIIYGNPMQDKLNIFHIETGVKDKFEMLHLRKGRYNLKAKSDCNSWNPTSTSKVSASEVVVCDYELEDTMCASEFDAGCLRNLQGAGTKVHSLQGTQQLSVIEAARVMAVVESVPDDVARCTWFGDIDFGTTDYDDAGRTYDLSGLETGEDTKLIAMLNVCNGIWSEIRARVTYGTMKYVDTNNGTAAGNAMNPDNIVPYLKKLMLEGGTQLRVWNAKGSIEQKPMFLLQGGLFEAYETYLEQTRTAAAHQFILDGTVIEGVLTFKGRLVVRMDEWDVFDTEVGRVLPSGYSKTQRALYVAPKNLVICADVKALKKQGDTGLMIQESPDIRDKGAVNILGNYRLGFGIAYDYLVVAGYNTSETYV